MVYQPGRGIPLYLQLAAEIRQRITTGELSPGDMAPGETALRDEFGVSRATAAKALDQLANEGLIRRRPGIGSEVIRTPGPVRVEVSPGTVVRARLRGPGDDALGLMLSVTPPGGDEQLYDPATVEIVYLGYGDSEDDDLPGQLRA